MALPEPPGSPLYHFNNHFSCQARCCGLLLARPQLARTSQASLDVCISAPPPSPPTTHSKSQIPFLPNMASLLKIPCEVRVNIYNRLLEDLPPRYGYTSLDGTKPWRRATKGPGYRQHGLILTNRKISSEYAQAFYNRTSFFFLIDWRNFNHASFWILSPALLPNLRQCQIVVDLPPVKTPEMKRFYKRLESLLKSMSQVRRVQLNINKSTVDSGWDDMVVWMSHEAPLLQERLQKLLRDLTNLRTFILAVKEYEEFNKVNGQWEAVADPLSKLPT